MSTNPMERGRFEWSLTDRLRKAREEAGLTQQQLADRIPTSLRTVSNYESPKYEKARKAVVIKQWALACGFPYELVAFGIERGPDSGGDLPVKPSTWDARVVPFRARSTGPVSDERNVA